jgi:hypothetical protein
MRIIYELISLLSVVLISTTHGLKVLEFSTSLEDNSRVTIIKDAPTPKEFTLCMDFYSRLDTLRRLLKSEDSSDIDIQIELEGYVIYVKVAGIWYIAVPVSPPRVETVTWGTICISYNSITQAVTVAFRNSIIFAEEQFYANRTLSGTFLKSLTLGEKTKSLHFAGDITRVNIWSKVLDDETLKKITDCGSSNFEELPDILNWDNVEVTLEGDIFEKDVDEYPCSSGSHAVHDVLMPYSANSMFEALKSCKVLGGNLNFPLEKKDVSSFVEKVKSNVDDSECGQYVWSKYYKNSYADNNWTVYESDTTFKYPPFEYAGWIDFALGQPNGLHLQPCAAISIEENPPLVYDVACYDKGYCFMCRLEVKQITISDLFSL